MDVQSIAQGLIDVWKKQADTGDYVFVSSKKLEGGWTDTPLKFSGDLKGRLVNWLKTHPANKANLYFCPLPFSEPRRKQEYVKGSQYLWSDMDHVNAKTLPLKPTLWWESSPKRFQGLWELDVFLDAKSAEKLNKQLTYMIGADKGGWDLTQVLRIPGTINHKYKEKPEVGAFVNTKVKYKAKVLEKTLSVAKEEPDDESVILTSKGLLAKYRDKIDRKSLKLLLSKNASIGKRSDIIWYLENKLHEVGLSPQEILVLVKASVWNKYSGRDDEDIRLRTEMQKILETKMGDEDDNQSLRSNQEDSEALGLRIETLSEVMTNLRSHPGWLVEGFWMRRSHGIVAGEPKSFKSILTLDLAISVASGKPFLGQFPVQETGPVLIIQNENSDWIMRDRMEKMIASKGLGGKAIVKGNKLSVTFPKEFPIYFVNQQGFLLNDPIHQRIVEEMIEQYQPILVMFDPLYLMFDGDVNSAKDLNPALNWLLKIKNDYDTGVVLIHHWNKGGTSARGGQRMLGSTTLHGWIESAWYLKTSGGSSSEDEDTSDDSITSSSNKPASLIIEREFRAGGTRGKVEASIRLGEVGDPLYTVEVKKHVGKGSRVVTENFTDTIINVLELHQGPVTKRRLAEETGSGRRAVKKALDMLAEEGRVNITKDGVELIPEL